jgi:F-type H+-transporting ATPase subunit delta
MHSSVAERYAKALLFSAKERNEIATIKDESIHLVELFDQSPDIGHLLQRTEKMPELSQSIAIELGKKLNLSYLLSRLLIVLSNRNRISIVESILKTFLVKIKEEQGIISANVTSIRQLESDEKSRINEKLNKMMNCQVEIVWQQDISILGGLYVRIGDQIFDGTLRTRIKQLQEHLTQ